MASMLVRDKFNRKTLKEEGRLHVKQIQERLKDNSL
jgi:hypothetical protein